MNSSAADKIIVALDVASKKEALDLVEGLREQRVVDVAPRGNDGREADQDESKPRPDERDLSIHCH